MNIQYCSDLHLEFPENKIFLKQYPIEPIGDILLLAGDIVPFALMHKQNDFFNYVSDNFKTTYWIPGNHEYYYSDLAMKSGSFQEKIKSNVFLLNNSTVKLEEVNIIFSTMWSKISPRNYWSIESGMSDFQVIKYNSARFSCDYFNQLHADSLTFIKKELRLNNSKLTVVVTHHVPTFQHYPLQYKGDVLNEAFAVELFDLIEFVGPDYWIYGHHHNNTVDFNIGHTKLTTNQLGYVKYNEHQSFKLDKHFNIDI